MLCADFSDYIPQKVQFAPLRIEVEAKAQPQRSTTADTVPPIAKDSVG